MTRQRRVLLAAALLVWALLAASRFVEQPLFLVRPPITRRLRGFFQFGGDGCSYALAKGAWTDVFRSVKCTNDTQQEYATCADAPRRHWKFAPEARTCGAHRFTPSEARQLLAGQRLVFGGDSIARNLYGAALRLLGQPGQDIVVGHQDFSHQLEGGISLHFYWAPYPGNLTQVLAQLQSEAGPPEAAAAGAGAVARDAAAQQQKQQKQQGEERPKQQQQQKQQKDGQQPKQQLKGGEQQQPRQQQKGEKQQQQQQKGEQQQQQQQKEQEPHRRRRFLGEGSAEGIEEAGSKQAGPDSAAAGTAANAAQTVAMQGTADGAPDDAATDVPVAAAAQKQQQQQQGQAQQGVAQVPAAVVLSTTLWHLLHFTQPAGFQKELSALKQAAEAYLHATAAAGAATGAAAAATASPRLLLASGTETFPNLMISEEKRQHMVPANLDAYNRAMQEARLLEPEGPFWLLNLFPLTQQCGEQCSTDGVHSQPEVYDAALQLLLNIAAAAPAAAEADAQQPPPLRRLLLGSLWQHH